LLDGAELDGAEFDGAKPTAAGALFWPPFWACAMPAAALNSTAAASPWAADL
jgi:hypothetical protein